MNKINDIKRTLNLVLAKKVLAIPQTIELKNKVVVVTGANGGLGKCIVEQVTSMGAQVIGLVRNLPSTETNKNLEYIKCDLRNETEVKSAFAQIFNKYKVIDVLINNAALTYDKSIEEMTSEDITSFLATNINSLFYTAKEVTPKMKEAKSGLILNIGSKISKNPAVGKNKTLYATTKYAVEGFTNALKSDLRDFGIRVICIQPATMNTFASTKSGNFLSPYTVAQIITDIIKYEDVDFENFVVKNKFQEI